MSLDDEHLKPLWSELHRRLSTGNPVSSIRLRGLGEEQRHAVSDLLGLPRLVPADTTVPLARLREVLPAPLDHVVTQIIGPLDNRAQRRRHDRDARTRLWQWFQSHPVIAGQPVLRDWAQGLPGSGLAGTVDELRTTLEQLVAVLEILPCNGVPLPKLADMALGDPHALDSGRLAHLIVKALAQQLGRPVPDSAAQRRELWDAVGVGCDAISTTVLVAGFTSNGTGAMADMLSAWAGAGQASAVTLAQLQVEDVPTPRTGKVVHVTENPSVLTMALHRFGEHCPPLVCTSGWPNSAGVRLLRTLAASGVELRYHGDFDPAGIRIVGYLMDKTGARPWRMSARDYLAGLAAVIGDGVGFRVDDVPDTPWDPQLAAAMREQGCVVFEESLVEELLDHLANWI